VVARGYKFDWHEFISSICVLVIRERYFDYIADIWDSISINWTPRRCWRKHADTFFPQTKK